MPITGVVLRRRVSDLGAAVDFYERLTGASANLFAFGGLELAAVGPFLLFAGADERAERAARVVATLTVEDVSAQAELLRELDAEILAPPSPTPNGHRLIARHPDGSVFEYVGP